MSKPDTFPPQHLLSLHPFALLRASPVHPTTIRGDAIPAPCQTIEVHLEDLNKLFDTMDPSPLRSKDLHPSVVEHIVDSAREQPSRWKPLALILHVDGPAAHAQDEQTICEATRAYFSHQALQARRRLRLHLRRGVISLCIGLSVLAAALIGSRLLGEGTIASTLRETLDIGGWVALWRPMEMFLYDWWPIVGDRMLFRRLGQMPIQIQYRACDLALQNT